jgi:hypothetical protein
MLRPGNKDRSAELCSIMLDITGTVRTILRLEGAAMLVLSAAAYSLLFFVPDLSMVGYLVGPRIGAVTYNAVHAYVGPAALVCAAVLWLGPLWLAIALIWSAHIGFDRAVGYGLKLPAGFQYTHRGPIGRSRPNAA